jgi:hypothetical protein
MYEFGTPGEVASKNLVVIPSGFPYLIGEMRLFWALGKPDLPNA